MKSDILLVSATRDEISDLLNISTIISEEISFSNTTTICARIENIDYDLIITNPCIINAVHGLTCALERKRPEIIINAGIAGVFKESNLNIGDIVIATKERYQHRGVENSSAYATPDNLPFDIIENKTFFSKSGIYSFNKGNIEKIFQILSQSKLAKECTISKGAVLTVSTITSTQNTASLLYKKYSSPMEAMEGAGLAHIASLYDIPFVEIRCGSNYTGERDKEKWNISLASKRVSSASAAIITRFYKT